MRAACGCLIDGDLVLHGYDGPCADEPEGPTEAEVCGSGGHAYAGDDAGRGRCYCGERQYAVGGGPIEAAS